MEEPGTGPGRGGGGKPEQERGALGPPPPHGSRNHEAFGVRGAARALSAESGGTAELCDPIVGNTAAPRGSGC